MCHQLSDHSKMFCEGIVQSRCPTVHPLSFKCAGHMPKLRERGQARTEDTRTRTRWDKLEASMAAALGRREEARLAKERAQAVQQKEIDLAAILALGSGQDVRMPVTVQSKHGSACTPTPSNSLPVPDYSTIDGRDPDACNTSSNEVHEPTQVLRSPNPPTSLSPRFRPLHRNLNGRGRNLCLGLPIKQSTPSWI